MADMQILRPRAGERVALENLENARLVLAFPPTEATLQREGDNLVFTFEDGGAVTLTGFYQTYTSESLPTFIMEGAEISGKDFFAALGEDLMPAAGPAAAAAAPAGGRYNEFGNDSLMSGVDRLDGLDLGFNNAAQQEDNTLGTAAAQSSTEGTPVAALDGTGGQGNQGNQGGNESPDTPTTPTEPVMPPVDPPVEPPVEPEKPVDPPVEPPVEPEKPVDPPVEPPVEPEKPVDPPVEPPVEPEKPVDPPVEPPVEPEKPVDPPAPAPSITIHNDYPETGSLASMKSSYGYYIKGPDGKPLDGKLYVIWDDVSTTAGAAFTIEGYTPDQLGFFIVPGGAGDVGNSYMDGTDTKGKYTLCDTDGDILGKDRKVIFDESDLNPDTLNNFISIDGKYQFWEDQRMGSSDWDLDDFRIRLEYSGWEKQPDPLGSPSNNTYTLEDGGMVIFGGVGANNHDTLTGGEHDDVLMGNMGNDLLYGNAGNDRLYGGDGKDRLFGGEGNDYLNGGQGDDELYGDEGDDILFGDSGNDKLYGGAGNDYLSGGKGDDTIHGGEGNDLIAFDADDLLIDGGEGMDVLLGSALDLVGMKSMLQSGKIDDVELLVSGKGVAGLTDMDELYEKLGITQDEHGKLDLGDGWQPGANPTQGADGSSYLEYVNNDGITILVQENILRTDAGGV